MQRLVRGAGLMPRLSLGLIRRQQSDLTPGLPIARPTTAQIARLFSSDTDFKPSEELAKERYDSRANEDIDRKRARLLYQSRKRGMLENGVILASFADRHLNKLDAEKLDQYDRLINLPTNDWDIFYWATNTKPTPPEFETPVMAMLREHLKSKVSNEDVDGISDSVLGKSRLDDIILPKKKRYELDIDPSQIDLVNYKSELFDDNIKTYKSSQHIQLMTDWRKRMFEHQLKRTVSSPTSLRRLTENDEDRDKVYTQRVAKKSIACEDVNPKNLIETEFEKAMKHHNFMQHLLSSNLTNDPLEYDDEAEAWANMVWVRNYGTDDDKISPSTERKCSSCHSLLHCCDSSLSGYVPREIFISLGANDMLKGDSFMCQRCKFRETYDAELSYDLSPDSYERFLQKLGKNENCIIVVLVDLTDFPGSIWKGLVDLMKSYKKQFLIVGNKLDLLPYDGPKLLERVNYAFRKNLSRLRVSDKNLHIADTMVLSARTGFGIEGLVTRILHHMDEEPRDVHLVGGKNSGKSTLFSALLQSDLSAIRTGDIISRVSRYEIPTQKVNMLRFPIERLDSWQIETKKRKKERVERDSALRIHALSKLSERRQDSMPHISALVNRLDYDQIGGSTALTERGDGQSTRVLPNFSDDHPLAGIQEVPPMSATKDKFQDYGFFHETPSSCHSDQLLNILTSDEKIEVFPNETIVPRRYSLRPLQTIFISGLGRVDLLTSQSNILLTVFASKYLPIHVVRTSKADKFYNQFLGTPYLGVPFGDHVRLAAWPELESAETDYHIRSNPHNVGSADIVLSSFAWVLVSVSKDQECIVRAYTPGGRGIFLRDPPLLSKASKCSLGKKIRDTPVFKNPNYVIESQRVGS